MYIFFMQFIEGFVMTLHMCMNLIESAANAPPRTALLNRYTVRVINTVKL